jgi:hypothetical protein
MPLTNIEIVRIEVQDIDPSLPLLPDTTYEYLLEKNENNIARTSIDAARIILMQLSQRGDETVDIFSIKGSRVADTYRQALELYLRNPTLNPLMQGVSGYFGGVSKSDMIANDANLDNNIITSPSEPTLSFPSSYFEL